MVKRTGDQQRVIGLETCRVPQERGLESGDLSATYWVYQRYFRNDAPVSRSTWKSVDSEQSMEAIVHAESTDLPCCLLR